MSILARPVGFFGDPHRTKTKHEYLPQPLQQFIDRRDALVAELCEQVTLGYLSAEAIQSARQTIYCQRDNSSHQPMLLAVLEAQANTNPAWTQLMLGGQQPTHNGIDDATLAHCHDLANAMVLGEYLPDFPKLIIEDIAALCPTQINM